MLSVIFKANQNAVDFLLLVALVLFGVSAVQSVLSKAWNLATFAAAAAFAAFALMFLS